MQEQKQTNPTICVFSSSSDALSEVYQQEAVLLSRLIGQEGYGLVNGGANVGLMEKMLKTAKESGSPTIGVIPEKMQAVRLESAYTDELIITKDMMTRKAVMREKANAFVALSGGFGTLEEILEVITLKQLDEHNKAIVFINTNHFYDDLFRQFDRSYRENFAKESYRSLYFIAQNSYEAIDYIKSYTPSLPVNKWYKVPDLK